MNADLLRAMLSARDEFKAEGDDFVLAEQANAALLLLAASGGPAPLNRLRAVRLYKDFLVAETDEDAYSLPYSAVVGVKTTVKGERTATRTGFRP
ncbi:MAG: hypothetical protein KC620_06595 [Myxococcales bacterium]|nr:hypothetical protein [Myxococcales bacterium]